MYDAVRSLRNSIDGLEGSTEQLRAELASVERVARRARNGLSVVAADHGEVDAEADDGDSADARERGHALRRAGEITAWAMARWR